ncbi:hypothetical protein [Parasitella parasitica]|uniref:Uncharacterized protein n=1 Tax=Parasitella parasitica TaxID=35722 RepID=A0A0B7MNA2_9FUNG|nr:hypothetical protein [Parasitella parasitica]
MHKNLKIDPLLDFDPLEDTNLHDPALASSDPATRLRKLQDLQNIRVLRAITFVRLSVRVSVARSMLSQDFISQAQFDAILADTLAARAAQIPAATTTVSVSAKERKEKKRIRVEYYFNLNYLDPVSALALASSPPPSGPSTGTTNAKASAAALNAMEV